ncbi:MAG: DoxX family membrane protein [Flavobacteriaceae bacterium]|nr:DoxX family membrane protein [Flavobacteriaceae bacterium]
MNKTLELVLRWLVGLMMLVFGANKFLNFMPAPEMPEGDLATFFQGFMASKYLMPLVGLVEVVVGILFLTKKWMPFALVLLAPISVNIVLIHLFLDPANIAMALLVFVANIALIYAYWGNLKYLFK